LGEPKLVLLLLEVETVQADMLEQKNTRLTRYQIESRAMDK